MPNETFFARLSRLFTDGARGFLQQTEAHRELDITQFNRSIQPVVLVQRPITSDTQSFDTIVDSSSRLRTVVAQAAWSGTGAGTMPGTEPAVGDYITLDSGPIAGNAVLAIPTTAPSYIHIYALEQLLYTVLCDATVATRTPIVSITAGMATQVLAAATLDFIAAASLPSLTASQEGRVFVPRAPALVQLNDNGTITTGAASPLPMLVDTTLPFQIAATLTAGVVGDTHRATAWLRRVA